MYVIRYAGRRRQAEYFAGWVDGAMLIMRSGRETALPKFGATREAAARYATSEEAHAQVGAMPFMASVMCDVEEVAGP